MKSQSPWLPNAFTPRPYQVPLMRAFIDEGKTRGIATFHRRAGKDRAALAITSVLAARRPGTYWHLLPTNVQARRVVWDAVSRTGTRLIDEVFPAPFARAKNEAEMSLDLRLPDNLGTSKWWAVGSDNYDRLVGTDPVGVVFSEYALAHPAAWNYVRPILAENGGWALFLSTPRGRNHFYDLWRSTAGDSQWFRDIRTVQDTNVITPEAIEFERRSGMPEELIQQEFYCSFAAGMLGAFYATDIARAEREGRVRPNPPDPALPLHFVYDLGFRDDTATVCFQETMDGVRVAHAESENLRDIGYYIERQQIICQRYGVERGEVWLPHDARAKTLQTGRSIVEQFLQAGIRPRMVPQLSLENGIQALRSVLPSVVFNCDDETGATGPASLLVEALKTYRREWSEERRVFSNTPVHDWSSNLSDAARYLALVVRKHEHAPPPSGLASSRNPAMLGAFCLEDLYAEQSRRPKNLIL